MHRGASRAAALQGCAYSALTCETMVTLGIPYKTPEGLAELGARSRALTQRHRTLLLLVDGQRTLDEVLHLAQLAGVPRSYIDELVATGLVVVPMTAPEPPAAGTTPSAAAVVTAMAPSLTPQPLPAAAPPRPQPSSVQPLAAARSSDVGVTSDFTSLSTTPMPAAPTRIEPTLGDDPDFWDDDDGDGESFGRALSSSELSALDASDQGLAEARNLLLHALRQEAPVAGAVTMLRVRRASTREALIALLPEVEQKIVNQRHLADAAEVIRRARELLDA